MYFTSGALHTVGSFIIVVASQLGETVLRIHNRTIRNLVPSVVVLFCYVAVDTASLVALDASSAVWNFAASLLKGRTGQAAIQRQSTEGVNASTTIPIPTIGMVQQHHYQRLCLSLIHI